MSFWLQKLVFPLAEGARLLLGTAVFSSVELPYLYKELTNQKTCPSLAPSVFNTLCRAKSWFGVVCGNSQEQARASLCWVQCKDQHKGSSWFYCFQLLDSAVFSLCCSLPSIKFSCPLEMRNQSQTWKPTGRNTFMPEDFSPLGP